MELTRNGLPRVVVTGLGALSPLGTLKSFWNNVVEGTSGIRKIQNIATEHLNIKIAGEVDFDPLDYIDRKLSRRMSRASQMAHAATQMAMDDAGLTKESLAPEAERVGVLVGTANAGFEMLVDMGVKFREYARRCNPVALVNGLPNLPAHYMSLLTGATGPLSTVVTACASGTQAVGEAFELVRRGRSDVVFTGGVDAVIVDIIMDAFDGMTVLASGHNDTPEEASRPFDADRSGFVLGEGAGVFVLETLDHALKRSARIYCEILGHASSSDAFHSAAPDAEGKGAQRSMRWAIEDARVHPADVSYINAHGTGTLLNDKMETLAIKRLFGEGAYNIPVSSIKSMIGHCMGAAGALEAISCVVALVDKVLPPTINYTTPDPDCDLDYVPNEARDADVQIALSNNFGLGGQNASLVLGAM
jgi:3-oxoacyl-[acyl-carrier-protein] synthase II